MCKSCKDCNRGKGGCTTGFIAKILVIVGGINWGVLGLGMLIGKDWNLVGMLLNSMPTILNIVYLLVGLSALIMIFGCKCKKCGNCASGICEEEKVAENMDGKM